MNCFYCKQEYEDSLVLGCNHSLCLNCAAKSLTRDEKYYNHKYIKCDLCQKLTSIEQQTLNEIFNNYVQTSDQILNSSTNNNQNKKDTIQSVLEYNTISDPSAMKNLINSNVNNQISNQLLNSSISKAKNFNTINNLNSTYNNRIPQFASSGNYENNSQTPKRIEQNHSNLNKNTILNLDNFNNNSNFVNSITGSNRMLQFNQNKIFCQKHNEEANYFCFTCFTKCICSECVIHGDHKGHEVLNSKQAYPIIIEKTNEVMNEISDKIIDIKGIQSSIEKSKIEVVSFTDKIKSELSVAFLEIKKRLEAKEKELQDKADKYLEDTLQEFNTYSRIIQSKVISLNKMIDSVNSNLLRKDEVNFINFFAESRKKLENIVTDEFKDFPDLSRCKTLKININLDSLNNMIHMLGGLHLEISMIKGFDLNKKVKSNLPSNLTRDYSSNSLKFGTGTAQLDSYANNTQAHTNSN